MAAMACSTCRMNEQPPTCVPPTKRGRMPRYSGTSFAMLRPEVNTASMSLFLSPASASALCVASMWSCSDDLCGKRPSSSDSATPTIATVPRILLTSAAISVSPAGSGAG